MSNTGANIKPEAIREIAFGSLTTSYQAFGPPFKRPVRAFSMDSDLDADVYVTLDPTEDQFRCRSEEQKVWDLKTNDLLANPGDQLYIRLKSAASSGDFFMEVITS